MHICAVSWSSPAESHLRNGERSAQLNAVRLYVQPTMHNDISVEVIAKAFGYLSLENTKVVQICFFGHVAQLHSIEPSRIHI
jgi:hypothetical protein